MRKRILMIGMTLLMAVVAIGCNGNQQNNNLKIQEQLDLGYKYLNELDYENAIATYMAILEVDAKCVSAYQGIAEVYMMKEDYAGALEYAKEGYTNTGDEVLAELVKQIETLIAEKEAVRLAAEEEAAAGKALFEEHCVDDIWHHAYEEYELTEEETTYLQTIIDNAKAGSYGKVFDLLQSDIQKDIVLNWGTTYTYDAGGGGMVRMAYNSYKVVVRLEEDDYGTARAIYLIPVTEDKGYYFCYDTDTHAGSPKFINKEYAVCDCEDGMYHGKLKGKRNRDSEEKNVHMQTDMEGNVGNGLREGVWLFHNSNLNADGNVSKDTKMAEYIKGKPKVYRVESNNNHVIKASVDESGNPDLNGGYEGIICSPEEFKNYRWGVGETSFVLSPGDNGGYWCYLY